MGSGLRKPDQTRCTAIAQALGLRDENIPDLAIFGAWRLRNP